MKTKLFIFLIACLISGVSLGQTNPKETAEYKRQKSIYTNAKRFSDVVVAKTAIYNLMALDPSDNSLLDSLAIMYFEYNQYAASLLVSLDILKKNPNHAVAKEISAVSYENLQLYDKALAAYESLYLQNNDLYTMYKIAFLQYNLKRFNESGISSDIILKDPKCLEMKIVFNPERNQQEEVSMKAAVLNLKGLLAKQAGNKEEAKAKFTEALAESNNKFTLAKQNLDAVDKN